MTDDAEGRVGSKVGNYWLVELLGKGAMGTVYKADHVYLGKRVAVKVLHSRFAGNDEFVKRFLREAWAASTINHPNIVQVTDFGETADGGVFLVMEYLDGQSLDIVLDSAGRFDLLRAVTVMTQLTSALAAAHASGIYHRDLKPENIVLTRRPGRRTLVREVADALGRLQSVIEPEGNFDFVKILDFGVAKVVRAPGEGGAPGDGEAFDDIATTGGTFFGTAQYVAPETARGAPPDPRGDVYSLGIIFYQMLTGTVPFDGPTPMDTLLQQIAEPVPPMRTRAPDAEITAEAEQVILTALAKEPEQRYQSMVEFHTDLQLCYGRVRYKRETTPLKVPPRASAVPPPPGLAAEDDVNIDVDDGRVPSVAAAPAARAATAVPVLLTKVKRPR